MLLQGSALLRNYTGLWIWGPERHRPGSKGCDVRFTKQLKPSCLAWLAGKASFYVFIVRSGSSTAWLAGRRGRCCSASSFETLSPRSLSCSAHSLRHIVPKRTWSPISFFVPPKRFLRCQSSGDANGSWSSLYGVLLLNVCSSGRPNTFRAVTATRNVLQLAQGQSWFNFAG